jgi:hypothetical protein
MFATWHIGFLAMGFLTSEMNVQYRRNPASGSETAFSGVTTMRALVQDP